MRLRIERFAIWRESEESPKPDVSFVPPLDRRRLTDVERAALCTAWPVAGGPCELPMVFASRWGEIGVTLKLMRQFHDDGEMSPAAFSASVHNAAAGAFSILAKNHAPYTAVAARERTLESGLIEALSQMRPVLFTYAEEATPKFYLSVFGEPQPACSVSALIVPDESGDVEVEFRCCILPYVSFEEWADFLTGKSSELSTPHFLMTRRSAAN